jgi:hypothetical protein
MRIGEETTRYEQSGTNLVGTLFGQIYGTVLIQVQCDVVLSCRAERGGGGLPTSHTFTTYATSQSEWQARLPPTFPR